MPDLRFIKAGTLDDTSWLDPKMHVYCDSAESGEHMLRVHALVIDVPPFDTELASSLAEDQIGGPMLIPDRNAFIVVEMARIAGHRKLKANNTSR